MKFTKNKGMFLAVVAITLAMFNALVFLLPVFCEKPNFWSGYVFSILAILIASAVGLYAIGRDDGGMKSKFYGLPLAYLAWSFVSVQMVAGIILMALPSEISNYGFVANVIIMGVYLIGFISVNAAREVVERIDAVVEKKVAFIKTLRVDIESLVARASDDALKSGLKELSESIRYSDPMSSPQLAGLEHDIGAKAAMLRQSLTDTSAALALIAELKMLIAERNQKCKMLK